MKKISNNNYPTRITNLYVNSYEDFNKLRTWVNKFYPNFKTYMPFYDLTYEKYVENKTNWINKYKEYVEKFAERFEGEFKSDIGYILNVIDYHKKNYGYECTVEHAKNEYLYYQIQLKKIEEGDEAIGKDYMFCVFNDKHLNKILKWRCPFPFVREHIHKQYWYSKAFEWLYKKFYKK